MRCRLDLAPVSLRVLGEFRPVRVVDGAAGFEDGACAEIADNRGGAGDIGNQIAGLVCQDGDRAEDEMAVFHQEFTVST